MKVRELIEELRRVPQEMEVCTWSADEDEWVPVTQALHEWGHTTVDLMTEPPKELEPGGSEFRDKVMAFLHHRDGRS